MMGMFFTPPSLYFFQSWLSTKVHADNFLHLLLLLISHKVSCLIDYVSLCGVYVNNIYMLLLLLFHGQLEFSIFVVLNLGH